MQQVINKRFLGKSALDIEKDVYTNTTNKMYIPHGHVKNVQSRNDFELKLVKINDNQEIDDSYGSNQEIPMINKIKPIFNISYHQRKRARIQSSEVSFISDLPDDNTSEFRSISSFSRKDSIPKKFIKKPTTPFNDNSSMISEEIYEHK